VGQTVVVALLLGGLVYLAGSEFGTLPPFGEPLMRVSETYLAQGLTETGAANLVASVILDYRAYDTLGEATILFAAAIGVATILRARGRKQAGKEGGA
jgi:multicomponent Na+:H+ antiporter subunit B